MSSIHTFIDKIYNALVVNKLDLAAQLMEELQQKHIKKIEKDPYLEAYYKIILAYSFIKDGFFSRAQRILLDLHISNTPEMSVLYSRYLRFLGITYYYQCHFEKSIQKYNEAFQINTNTTSEKALILYNIGISHYRLSQYEQSELYLSIAGEMLEELGELHVLGQVLIVLGMIHKDYHNYEVAMNYYQKAIKIGDKEVISKSRNYIAEIHYRSGNYDTAKKMLEELILESEGNSYFKVIPMYHLAKIYFEQKHFPEFLSRIAILEKELKHTHNPTILAKTNKLLGDYYLECKSDEFVRDYYIKTIHILENYNLVTRYYNIYKSLVDFTGYNSSSYDVSLFSEGVH